MAGNDELSRFYGYIPNLAVCIIILSLFFISGVLHAGQAIKYRMWHLLYTAALGAFTESIGWGGRLWSHFAPQNLNPYLIQTVTTINAPTLLIAAYFVTLAEIIRRLGPCYSRMKPRMYTIVFCSADFLALSIQGVGGGLAATAAGNNTSPDLGGNIMLGGIVFQMVAITLYMALAAEFLIRFFNDKPFKRPYNETIRGTYKLDNNMKMMLCAMAFATLLLYIRSIYRVIELTDGWTGRIITTEIYFNILDGAMIVGATWTLNIFHPGRLLGPETSDHATGTYEGVGIKEVDNTADPLLHTTSGPYNDSTAHSRNDSSLLSDRFDGSTVHDSSSFVATKESYA